MKYKIGFRNKVYIYIIYFITVSMKELIGGQKYNTIILLEGVKMGMHVPGCTMCKPYDFSFYQFFFSETILLAAFIQYMFF